MNISIFENKNFLDIITEFANDFKFTIEFLNKNFNLMLRINNVTYIVVNQDLNEGIRILALDYLKDKAKDKQITLETLIDDWKNLEELFEEIKGLKE